MNKLSCLWDFHLTKTLEHESYRQKESFEKHYQERINKVELKYKEKSIIKLLKEQSRKKTDKKLSHSQLGPNKEISIVEENIKEEKDFTFKLATILVREWFCDKVSEFSKVSKFLTIRDHKRKSKKTMNIGRLIGINLLKNN